MTLTVAQLLYQEIVWNKQKVVIDYNGKLSKCDRLEFQYEAIDNDYKVYCIEPVYNKETNTVYLLIGCE
jgi:hypothetical protein